MRAVGLEPMITLYHFTLPLWLYERGGWERPQAATHFVRYVERAVGAFGDLCRFWCTINEPMVYLSMGYIYGTWPPGCGSLSAARDVFRNLVAAHAGAYEVIHREQTDAQVGYAKHLRIFEPADPERWLDRKLVGWMDHLFNESALVGFADGTLLFPFGWPGRTGQAAAGPELLDFIGLNYYARDKVAFDRHRQDEMFIRFANDPAITPAGMGHAGEIYPHGLYRALVRVAGYDLPIYVTEFGLPDSDDSLRSRFIVEHVAAMGRALAEGVPLRGAYFWSLVDNFEWAEGWSARFGLMALDPQTQERTPRPSARVYRRIAKANGLERSLVGEIAPDLVAELFDPRATSREARSSQ
jgi:beta-glucosidase